MMSLECRIPSKNHVAGKSHRAMGESWQTTQLQECTFHPVRRDCSQEGSEHPDGKSSSQMPDVRAFSLDQSSLVEVSQHQRPPESSVFPGLIIQSLLMNCSWSVFLARSSHSWNPLWHVPPPVAFFLWFPCFLQPWASKCLSFLLFPPLPFFMFFSRLVPPLPKPHDG